MIAADKIQIQKRTDSKLSQVDFNNIPFGKIYSDHMFMADYVDGQWQNLRITPYADLQLNPACPALHYGQTIFEGMKGYKTAEGEINLFRPLDNFRRLNVSAERMCIPELPEEVFMNGLSTLLDIDRSWVPDVAGTSLYIRPFIISADEYIGIRPSDNFTFMIITCPVGAYYSKPVKVKIETHYTRAAAGGTGYAKAGGNYGGALYPARLAQKDGYDQLIWTDAKEHKYIEESGTMNVMFVIGDTLVTATTGDTILHGITRDSVLALARDWGMNVEERPVTVEEVISAARNGTLKEAFGAGTAATIAHIAEIGYEGIDHKLPEATERKFSNRVLRTLDNIKLGRTEDKFGWIYKL